MGIVIPVGLHTLLPHLMISSNSSHYGLLGHTLLLTHLTYKFVGSGYHNPVIIVIHSIYNPGLGL